MRLLVNKLKTYFPAINVIPYTYSLYPFIRNNRKYNVLIFYKVLIEHGADIHLL